MTVRAAFPTSDSHRVQTRQSFCAPTYIAFQVPSSINRVYSLIRPDTPNIALAYVAGLVLSLMGFWNSVIYIVTSRAACKELFFSAAMYHLRLRIPNTEQLSGSSRRRSSATRRGREGFTWQWEDDAAISARGSKRGETEQHFAYGHSVVVPQEPKTTRVSWGDESERLAQRNHDLV